MIQISYENDALSLEKGAEQRLESNISAILDKLDRQSKGISLFFCSKETMKNLNRTYRKIDRPTDILSWSYGEEDLLPEEEPLLGELALCPEVCKENAEKTGWDYETELLRLVVHGIGHLMGFDHELSEEDEKRMLEFEKNLLAGITHQSLYD